jgi:hypothetical protein
VSETAQRFGNVPLDRVLGNAERSSDFFVGSILYTSQPEHFAAARGEIADARNEACKLLVATHAALRSDFLYQAYGFRIDVRTEPHTRVVTLEIGEQVASHSKQKRPRELRSLAGRRHQDPNVDFLLCVLDLVLMAQAGSQKPAHPLVQRQYLADEPIVQRSCVADLQPGESADSTPTLDTTGLQVDGSAAH